MDCDWDHNAGTVLLAMLIGAAVGAGLTLLIAPQSGKRTRRQISELAEDLRDYASDVGRNVRTKVR